MAEKKKNSKRKRKKILQILLVVVLLHLKYKTYSNIWLCAMINVPGTILHEFMHFLVGLFLNAQPSNFSIFPKKSADGKYVMGSVLFKNIRFYNALPSALAPLALLAVGFCLNKYWLPNMHLSIINYVAYVLLQTIIIENAMPSSVDFKVAFKYPAGVALYAIILFFGLILL